MVGNLFRNRMQVILIVFVGSNFFMIFGSETNLSVSAVLKNLLMD